MTEQELKKIYYLWIEYLKLSPKYQIFCNQMKGRSEISLSPLPDEFKGKEGLIVNYIIFGNVHEKSFEEIWPSLDFWNAVASPISDYGESISSVIDDCIDNFKNEHGKEPTANEIKELLVKMYQNPTTLYLKIDLTNGTLDEVVDRFKKMIKDYREARKTLQYIKKHEISSSLFLKLNTRINMKKVKKCLDIYHLKVMGKLKMKQVIEKIGDKTEVPYSTEKNIQRPYWKDLKRAKEIINNVEKGIFP